MSELNLPGPNRQACSRRHMGLGPSPIQPQGFLDHVPVLGYRTVREVARDHEDLLGQAELKKGEGLVIEHG